MGGRGELVKLRVLCDLEQGRMKGLNMAWAGSLDLNLLGKTLGKGERRRKALVTANASLCIHILYILPLR